MAEVSEIDRLNAYRSGCNGLSGLTKREYFSSKAMQAYISTGKYTNDTLPLVAQLSVKAADALLLALERGR